jgi:hypothetical protein
MWYRGGDARAAAALMFFLLESRFLARADFLSTLASAVSSTASEKTRRFFYLYISTHISW